MTGQSPGGSPMAQVNGAAVRYRRRGDGRAVVLLHPLRMQLEYFDPVCSDLGDADAELIAVDLPGHGHSRAPAADYTASYFTNAVEALLDNLNVADAIVVGYGRWGGIRRSSAVGNIVFTTMLLPLIGPVVAQAGTKGVLRRVLDGGLYDPRHLTPQLVDQLYQSGRRPGHGRALRSLSRNWHSWISARDRYPAIQIPVTLAYGDHDWSNHDERDANRRAIPAVRATTIHDCGHFSSLDQPAHVAALIQDFLALTRPNTYEADS